MEEGGGAVPSVTFSKCRSHVAREALGARQRARHAPLRPLPCSGCWSSRRSLAREPLPALYPGPRLPIGWGGDQWDVVPQCACASETSRWLRRVMDGPCVATPRATAPAPLRHGFVPDRCVHPAAYGASPRLHSPGYRIQHTPADRPAITNPGSHFYFITPELVQRACGRENPDISLPLDVTPQGGDGYSTSCRLHRRQVGGCSITLTFPWVTRHLTTTTTPALSMRKSCWGATP